MSSKVLEAQEHCKNAEKHLKTSMVKWKPDFDAAADEYSQAAQCYRVARKLKECKECHVRAAEFYQKNRSLFHAAKALENAILVEKDNTPVDEMYRMATDSCNMYQEHGSGDSAANVLNKTARILEENHPEKACKLYQRASEVSAAESSSHQGIEYTSKATRLLLKLRLYDQAADSVRQEIGFHLDASNYGAIGRLTVAAVLIHLARGDVVAAEKSYKEWGANCDAAETETLEALLSAYDDEDQEGAKRALKSPFIRSMDIEYARLVSSIELPQGEPMPSVGVRKNAAPSYVSGQAGPPTAGPAQDAAGSSQAAASSHSRFDDIEESPLEAGAKEAGDGDEGGFC